MRDSILNNSKTNSTSVKLKPWSAILLAWLAIGAPMKIALGNPGTMMTGDYDALGYDTGSYNGPYLGGGIGYGKFAYKDKIPTAILNADKTAGYDDKKTFAVQGYLGYNFSQFLAAELGYIYFGHPKFTDAQKNTFSFKQSATYLAARVNVPISHQFSVYGKLGLAMVKTGPITASNNLVVATGEAHNRIVPLYGLGINYWLGQLAAIEIAWVGTMKMGKLPKSNLFTIGIINRLVLR